MPLTSHFQAARLQVRIDCKSSAAKIENHIVADEAIHSYFTAAPLGRAHVVGKSISKVRNPPISDRKHLRAIAVKIIIGLASSWNARPSEPNSSVATVMLHTLDDSGV